MKRCLAALCAVLFLMSSALAAGPNGVLPVTFHEGGTYIPVQVQSVALTLNGAPLVGDVPAMIHNNRTLVPVRLVSEALAAQVLWVQETAQVILLRGTDVIVLTLGSKQAQVNGKSVDLPDGVPAVMVTYQGIQRTMVPLRFVSEQLGAEIRWDQATYTAHLTTVQAPTPTPVVTPTPPPAVTLAPPATPVTPAPSPAVTPIPPVAPPSTLPTVPPAPSQVTDILNDSNAQTVLISTNHKPVYQITDFEDRVVVDVKGATLTSSFPGSIAVDNELISAVRYSEHGADLYPAYDHTVRVVLDLQPGVSYSKNVTVKALANGVLITTYDSSHGIGGYVPSVPIDPQKSTIVIDPGHGGIHVGAVYEGVQEKSINLSVSLKLQAILQNYGYNVVMTRSDDTDVDLYARADIANAVNADLFVSLHSNSAVKVPTFRGIYTYHHPTSKRGAVLAQAIQTPLSRITGAVDQGIKDADFVVIRETKMCAVLVEMGFMTNHDELMNLTSASYQDKLAQGVAEGIISYLNGLK